jgi:hypothetical protein
MRGPDQLRDWRGFPSVPGDLLPVAWSEHSVEQFVARVRELPLDDARRELSRMLATATVTKTRPEWVKDRGAHAFMLLGEGICLPLWRNHLGELVASTVLTTSMPASDEDRERENAWRRSSRAGKRASRIAQKRDGHRPVHLPSTTDDV